MNVVSQTRQVIEVLERCYRDAERAIGRPARVEDGVVPEPTEVDARAANQAAAELLAMGVVENSWEGWLRISWFPYLRQFPGYDRRIGEGWTINDRVARFPIDGDAGRAYATAQFKNGRMVGMAEGRREKQEGEPPQSVTIACPPEHWHAMKAFYRSLTGQDLPCREAGEPYLAPRWPDPEYPQQMHLDVFVGDLDAAEEMALANGGHTLQDAGTYRTYADPLGHPICLYPDPRGANRKAGTIARIVIDCPDPLILANFYDQFLRMPHRVEDSPDRIVIVRDAETFPMLAFQRVENYIAPRWPDPAYPAQMHFDLGFDDRAAAERRATELGATWIRPQHEKEFGHVFADPAGHPFCLLEPGD